MFHRKIRQMVNLSILNHKYAGGPQYSKKHWSQNVWNFNIKSLKEHCNTCVTHIQIAYLELYAHVFKVNALLSCGHG